MKKRILFTGGSGLLATNWAMQITPEFDVVLGLHTKNIELPGIETFVCHVESADAFAEDLRHIHPDIVVHCVSLTSVEKCELDPVLAAYTNIDLTENVARACLQQNVKLVHISTDHLFSGEKPLVAETETVQPLNEYGRTKALAEIKLFELSADFLCIRTNFYGWGTSYRSSFSDQIIGPLRNNQTISLFTDVFYSPILIATFVETVMSLIGANAKGIFNVVGNERISKYEFGVRVAKKFGLDHSLINKAKFELRTDLVQRPFDLSLSNSKATTAIGHAFGMINEDIERLYQQEQDGVASILKNI